jgi:hypothetical protein
VQRVAELLDLLILLLIVLLLLSHLVGCSQYS